MRRVTGSLIGRKNFPTTALLQSFASGMSDVSMSLSRNRTRAASSSSCLSAPVFIRFPFELGRFSCRYDPDLFFSIFFFLYRVHHRNEAQRLPAIFALAGIRLAHLK